MFWGFLFANFFIMFVASLPYTLTAHLVVLSFTKKPVAAMAKWAWLRGLDLPSAQKRALYLSKNFGKSNLEDPRVEYYKRRSEDFTYSA